MERVTNVCVTLGTLSFFSSMKELILSQYVGFGIVVLEKGAVVNP